MDDESKFDVAPFLAAIEEAVASGSSVEEAVAERLPDIEASKGKFRGLLKALVELIETIEIVEPDDVADAVTKAVSGTRALSAQVDELHGAVDQHMQSLPPLISAYIAFAQETRRREANLFLEHRQRESAQRRKSMWTTSAALLLALIMTLVGFVGFNLSEIERQRLKKELDAIKKKVDRTDGSSVRIEK